MACPADGKALDADAVEVITYRKQRFHTNVLESAVFFLSYENSRLCREFKKALAMSIAKNLLLI